MTTPRTTASALARCLLGACLLAASLQAPAAPDAGERPASGPHAGLIKNVLGDVHVVDASGAHVPARPGHSLWPHQRIVTGAASGASVILRDGTTLVVGERADLDLQAFSFNASTHDGSLAAALLQGTLRMVTGLIGKKNPEAVRVDTPTATIGIRGTDFIVTAEARP